MLDDFESDIRIVMSNGRPMTSSSVWLGICSMNADTN